MNKKIVKTIKDKADVCNGIKPIHNVIDELEQCRLQLGMTPQEFNEYFNSFKPNLDIELDMSKLIIYGTAGDIDGSNNFFK